MGFINLAEKTINAKLVYYGCGMGGKTTSLQVVHEIMCPRNEVQLVSIKTEDDATLLFDFLPIDIGQVEGFKVRIQGFTVPGQPKYRRMRKYVLNGADAVVFVADSETSRLDENVQSFDSLRENLGGNGLDESSIPIVLQYNKRDLSDTLSEQELDEQFMFREDLKSFPSVAVERRGVWEAFVEAVGQLVDAKVRLYGLGRGKVAPEEVAESARQKLWEIFDASDVGRALREEEASGGRPTLELTFDEEERTIVDTSPSNKVRTEDDLDLDNLEDDVDGEEMSPQSGVLFTDEDFEFDLDATEDASAQEIAEPVDLVAEAEEVEHDQGEQHEVTPQARPTTLSPAATIDDEEPLPELLDATVATNIQLVQRFGELERYVAQLEQKNRELVEIAQNVVHDLNRPLSAIRLMLSSMKKGYAGDLSDMATQCVDTGLSATEQMDRLIRDMLDSSRLDFDGVHLDFAECDLAILVARILGGMRYELDEHDVRVRVEPLPAVVCDEWMITRVLGNLLGNAIQYHHPDRSPRIWIQAREEADRVLVEIRDNGIGVPAEDLPTLFQRFVRGSNTGGISGTGLGLHITREIMLGHGGDAWVESAEGEGTTFYLAFPYEPVQPPHSAVSDIDPAAQLEAEELPILPPYDEEEEDYESVASGDDEQA